MGTAAENERIKLKAAFYNNLATGVVITGYAVPYFAFVQKMWDVMPQSSWTDLLLSKDLWLLYGIMPLVLGAAWILRRVSNQILEDFED